MTSRDIKWSNDLPYPFVLWFHDVPCKILSSWEQGQFLFILRIAALETQSESCSRPPETLVRVGLDCHQLARR